MNTQQKYEGQPSQPNTVEQTAQPIPTTYAELRSLASICVSVNKELYDSLTQLFQLSEDFVGIRREYTPTEVLNELLYNWITSQSQDYGFEKKLETILDLTTFLSHLQRQTGDLTYLNGELERESEANDKTVHGHA